MLHILFTRWKICLSFCLFFCDVSKGGCAALLASQIAPIIAHTCTTIRRGGIPLLFPQYGRASGVAAYAGVGNGRVPTNGFLSHLHWTLVDAGPTDPDSMDPSPTIVLETESTEETYAVWPYHFRALYTVRPPPLMPWHPSPRLLIMTCPSCIYL